jgi:TetR/AcrR family transcriptional regulator of autoinduction and epiphytic fitness
MPPVKSGKTTTRADRARQTRHRMLDRARELFVTQGYAATTMERIADEAGVAVQTLYYTFRTKGQLLREVIEVTAAGERDAAPVAQRAWTQEMLTAPSAQRVLALGVEHGTDIFERAAPLWPAVAAAAAADPDVEGYWRGVSDNRRAGQARMVARLTELGALRHGLDPDHATDLVVVLFGHDVFHGLVSEAGWNVAAYKAWLFTTLVQQLLQQQRLAPTAFSNLSYGRLLTKP